MLLEKRYSEALKKLPHDYLLGLPCNIKQRLHDTTDLEKLVNLLELMVRHWEWRRKN